MVPEPSVTQKSAMTDEDQKRAALRLAALRSLKSSSNSKRARLSRDIISPSRPESLTQSNTETSPQPDPVMNENMETSSKQSQEEDTQGQKHSNNKTGYRDVDMPDSDAVDLLSYLGHDQETPTLIADARSARPRISYADEFNTQPVAPTGELEDARWLELPTEPAASTPPRHVNPKPFPKRQTALSGTSRQDHYSVSHSLTENTFAKFVNRPLHEPFIIEWSDEDDSEEFEMGPRVNSSRLFGHYKEERANSYVPSAVLTEKEREIKRMMARIQELEQKKKVHHNTQNSSDSNQNVHSPSVLGKRAERIYDVECQSYEPSSKVRCSPLRDRVQWLITSRNRKLMHHSRAILWLGSSM